MDLNAPARGTTWIDDRQRQLMRTACLFTTAAWAVAICSQSQAQVYISEIFWDPPSTSAISNLEDTHEYIELRGVPNLLLDNYYLLFIENEDNSTATGGAGNVDLVFDLSGQRLGANGFLVLRQNADTPSTFARYAVDPGATDLVQSGGTAVPYRGWGNNGLAAPSSSVGASLPREVEFRIENGGFTAWLIRDDSEGGTAAPVVGFSPLAEIDLDAGNDGLDHPNGREGWTVLDTIGIHSEFTEADYGRTYARTTFGADFVEDIATFGGPRLELPTDEYVGLGFELEYLGRWGASWGSAPDDWHVSNLTDNSLSGFSNNADFRQSGDPHPPGPGDLIESSRTPPVAYGTNLTSTLGAPNYPYNTLTPGDFDLDGDVDGDDLHAVFETRFGLDYYNGDEFLAWQRNYAPPAPAGSVPEPGALAVALAGIACWTSCRRARN